MVNVTRDLRRRYRQIKARTSTRDFVRILSRRGAGGIGPDRISSDNARVLAFRPRDKTGAKYADFDACESKALI